MPRSFLVKRRKSADAKSVFDSDFLNNDEDGLTHAVKQHVVVPSSQRIKFHPPSFHFYTPWNQSNTSCFHYRTRTLPHTTDNELVNLPARGKCREPQCCECFHRKLEEHTGCFCCLSPAPKLLSDVSQLHVSSWCSGINYDCGCHGIYFPKHDLFYPKPLHTPLKRLDFQGKEVTHEMDKDVPMHHIGEEVERDGVRLKADLKVVQKDETLMHDETAREEKVETMEEIPAKKMKMAITDKEDIIVEDDSGKASTLQNTTQSNTNKDKETNDEKLSVSQAKIKQGFSALQNANTNNSEHCNGEFNNQEESETKPIDVQIIVPHKVSRKPKHGKAKKDIKGGIGKPYNTRVTTSRPRVYSSDFVVNEEEDDWKKDMKEYQMKGRQKSKLNRLLANEHERRRVAQLNSAYQDLRQLIPGYQCDTKLPKIKILKYAINYIAHLDDILGSA